MSEQEQEGRTPTEQEIAEIAVLVEWDPPAVISQREWDHLKWRVWDTHRAITELEKAIRPAMESISSGKFSLAGMLLGKR